MAERTVQLILHYDGAAFAGWQRQPNQRTVQGALETALRQLCGQPVPVLGAGRTDAGVHARGQSAGVVVAEKWTPRELRRALNAVLPADVWVADAHQMQPDFHARYSAAARRYTYRVGTDDDSRSPFRRRYELAFPAPLDIELLQAASSAILGDHSFRAFAVQGTAPETDEHRCNVTLAEWRPRDNGLDFAIEANRFLHHMVRFLVGTMLDVGTRRRPISDLPKLLGAPDNREVSPPAPAHALFLDGVDYPSHLYFDV